MASPVIQFKRGALNNVPGLRAGEPALTTDSYDLYVGIDSTTNNNKFFGSHRYWTKETATTGSGINFVERTDSGSNKITLKAPNTGLGTDTTYTLPATPTEGYFLKTNASGELTWDTVSAGASFSNSTFSGITTFNGGINAGIVTVTDLYIDTTRVLYDDGSGITLAGISTIDSTTKATLESILALEPNNFDTLNVTGISTFGGTLNANGSVVLGDASGDTITVKGTATFEQPIVGTISTATQVSTSSTDTNASHYLTFVDSNNASATPETILTDASVSYNPSTNILNLAKLKLDNELYDGNNSAGTSAQFLTSTGVGVTWVTIEGVGGSGIATAQRAVSVDTTGTSDNADYYVTFVDTLAGQTSETLRVGAGLSVNPSTGDVKVSNDLQINGNDIKSSTGSTVVTLNGDDATFASDLTVQGNLYVNGSTTQVNVTELTVYDRTITLGVQSATTPVATSWDLGVMMNYGDAGVAKTAGVIWEYANKRFQFALDSDNPSVGINTTTPNITVTTFAPIEVGGLWVNNSCTGGVQEVIGCVNSELNLQNIIVDGGTF